MQREKALLGQIESNLCHGSRRVPSAGHVLTFPAADDANSAYTGEPPLASLPLDSPSNVKFVCHYNWVLDQQKFLEDLPFTGDRDLGGHRKSLGRRLQDEIQRLDGVKWRAWQGALVARFMELSLDDTGPVIVATGTWKQPSLMWSSNVLIHPTENTRSNLMKNGPFIAASLLLVTVLHTLAAAARLDCSFILAGLRYVIFTCLVHAEVNTRRARHLADSIPKDVRTAIAHLGLEPDVTIYASCPICCALYPPDPKTPHSPYPRKCTAVPDAAHGPCDSDLVETRTVQQRKSKGKSGSKSLHAPIRPYPVQNLRSWISKLLSRPGIEQSMEDAWLGSGSQGVLRDIWDAPALKEFAGPDGKTLFSIQPDGALHLVFSLFVDWFNPYGNKAAGKKRSLGAIYMTCLNLPKELRFRSENIFLAGIIPGPSEPDFEQTNHFLRPIVDELLIFWKRGYRLSSTSAKATGRMIRGAVIPLVCDVPAHRKVTGTLAVGSRCSFCGLPEKEYNELNPERWPKPMTWSERLGAALAWRNEPSRAQREKMAKKTGIRWSELLRLEYWDPTRFAIVDSMHNLFLGALRHHCQDIWEMDVNSESDKTKLRPHTPEEQQVWLDKVAKALAMVNEDMKKALSYLMKARKGYLVTVAQVNGVVPEGGFSKPLYARALVRFVRSPYPHAAPI